MAVSSILPAASVILDRLIARRRVFEEEAVGSQQGYETQDAEYDVERGNVGFQQFSSDDEGDEIEDGGEGMNRKHSHQLQANDNQENPVEHFIERRGIRPIHSHQRVPTADCGGDNSDQDEEGQRQFEPSDDD